MKEVFVLDENVFIQSHTCKSIEKCEDDDFNSLELIIQILNRCHKIGFSSELVTKYAEKEKMLKDGRKICVPSLKIWKSFLYRQDKQSCSENHLNDLPTNVVHDRHVVEAAFFLSGVLVTTDGKLSDRIKDWCRANKQTLRVMSPKDAISYLKSV